MKRNHLWLTGAVLLASLVACNDQVPTFPATAELDDVALADAQMGLHAIPTYEGVRSLQALTWNIYVGTNVDIILGAQNPAEIPILAAQGFQMLLATNFAERADAIANQIDKARPHLVGLQEISKFYIQSPGDAVMGGTTPAEDVFLDFLEILMAALEARGLEYYVAGMVENVDAEIPMLTSTDPLTFDDVRLTDYDVVLARRDVPTSDVEAKNYTTNLVVPSLGLEVKRGYVAVTADLRDRMVRFVSTHLEPASSGEAIQLAQAQELVTALSNYTIPVILTGDLNTRRPDATTYNFFVAAGFDDSWMMKRNQDHTNPHGYTSNHDDDLRNAVADLHEVVDYVMIRTPVCHARVRALVLGDELKDRTASGLWPSDHAGLAARMLIADQHQELVVDGIQQVAADVANLGDPAAQVLGPVLDRAMTQVCVGHLERAVERLRNFKGRVRLQMRKGTITEQQGQALLDAVQPMIRECRQLGR